MKLGEAQEKFAFMVCDLLAWCRANGYQIRLGDAYRDPRLHGEVGVKMGYGHAKSCHKIRLAIDLLLFKDGKYLTDEASYAPLHDYWDSLGGAPRIASDANHFSLAWEGMR